MNTTEPTKPLRKDALINRQRILDAAAELFAQRGLGVTLNDVAHHAGVGVGTVYRRFPDKHALIEDLFEQRFEEMVELAEESLDDPDPWHGMCRFMEQVLELQANNSGLRDLVFAMPDGLATVRQVRARLLPLGEEVIRRAQQSGQLRTDVSAQDLPILQMMIGAIIDATRDLDPNLWRRYLQLILSGLTTNAEAKPPLTVPALNPEDTDIALSRPTRAVAS
jgi:AcrR family transcriptional regulator